MIKVHERVYVGNETDCMTATGDWSVVHACKSPCHQRAVGYRGSLKSSHPNYLVYERGQDLFLNIIDPPRPLFMPPLFTEFLSFAFKHWKDGKKLLIHCNQGESRAPSLALLFLSKCLSVISSDSYDTAKSDFIGIYPRYAPGKGIQIYLKINWNSISI